MELGEYQREAQKTDQFGEDEKVVPLLGMGGEVGSLLAEYKKFMRDGPAHVLFPAQVAEELGDILWYLANAATKFELDLDAIAAENLAKTRDRWPPDGSEPVYRLFDDEYPETEQLPRRFTAEIHEETEEGGKPRIVLTIDGLTAGDPLQDNSHDPDGYRFHDVFHLAHAAHLGWSPVLRGKLLKHKGEVPPDRKRRSDNEVNEVEDGGRAIVIDEAVVAYVWEYARRHNFLDGVSTVDYGVLKTIKHLTGGLEVAARSSHQWEEAILAGYRVWRQIKERRQGVIAVDLKEQRIDVVS
ncbi:MAG TPA: nucleoside triphosphate pyrophosphohydrolase family protein [Candidatus Dormibacteraeota bacterium]|nr:nucleoside triphosphate pyrophosphohydrolase family protein [Candidatus Dormibacteraeota bacterium]